MYNNIHNTSLLLENKSWGSAIPCEAHQPTGTGGKLAVLDLWATSHMFYSFGQPSKDQITEEKSNWWLKY